MSAAPLRVCEPRAARRYRFRFIEVKALQRITHGRQLQRRATASAAAAAVGRHLGAERVGPRALALLTDRFFLKRTQNAAMGGGGAGRVPSQLGGHLQVERVDFFGVALAHLVALEFHGGREQSVLDREVLGRHENALDDLKATQLRAGRNLG